MDMLHGSAVVRHEKEKAAPPVHERSEVSEVPLCEAVNQPAGAAFGGGGDQAPGAQGQAQIIVADSGGAEAAHGAEAGQDGYDGKDGDQASQAAGPGT